MSAVASDLPEEPAALADAVVAHVREMRGWMRFFAVTGLILTLWTAAYGGATLIELSGFANELGQVAGLIYLGVAIALLVPARLLWRQADAASRFVAAPSEDLFVKLTHEIRRFWRISGVLAAVVFLLTVVVWIVLVINH